VIVVRDDDLGAEFAGERKVFFDAALGFGVEWAGGFNADGDPRGALGGGHAAGPADELRRGWTRADGDEETFAGAPDGLRSAGGAEFAEAFVHALGDEAEGEFAEGGKVGVFEETLGGGGGAVAEIDFALAETLEERLGREVDELDLIGEFEDGIGDSLVNGGAGDLADGVGAGFEMLDVERGEDVEAGVEEFDDVLVTLRVARAGGVGVGELIDKDELWAGLSGERGFEIELGEFGAAVSNGLAREDGQAGEESFGVGTAVSFNEADDESGAVAQLLLGGAEHGVGFADAGAHAEEDFQTTAARARLVAAEGCEEGVGIRPRRCGHDLLYLVEGAIQQEHVDGGLAEDDEVAGVRGGGDEGGDLVEGEVARFGDAGGLEAGVGGADVRIESAGGGGDGVGGDGGVRGEVVGGAVGGDGGGDGVGEFLGGGAEIRAGGTGGVVAGAGGGGARLEVARRSEGLREEGGAADGAGGVDDEGAVGLGREECLGAGPDGERICAAEEDGEDQREEDGGAEFG
jgi:hypothetical protein